MSATESRSGLNVASTTATFSLIGGKYSFDAVGSWSSGSVQVELLAPDASTWLNCGSAVSANGVQTLDLPAGQYRVAVSGSASAVYFALTRIAED